MWEGVGSGAVGCGHRWSCLGGEWPQESGLCGWKQPFIRQGPALIGLSLVALAPGPVQGKAQI